MLQRVVRNSPVHINAGLAGFPIVQPGLQPGVDDLLSQLLGRIEVADRMQRTDAVRPLRKAWLYRQIAAGRDE